MAHFAELDANNIVLRVIVVDTKDNSDANGVEKEYIGAAFCERLFGGNWKQTSYNGNIRKRYAGVGYKYDEALDAFIAPKPYPSWILNSETLDWNSPVPMPSDVPNEGEIYQWNEEQGAWTLIPNSN